MTDKIYRKIKELTPEDHQKMADLGERLFDLLGASGLEPAVQLICLENAAQAIMQVKKIIRLQTFRE